MQAIGDKCYVIAVKPGSDAEAKGLKRGDLILSIDGFTPTREVVWKILYYYYTLRPKPGMRLVVQSPEGAPRQVDVSRRGTCRPQARSRCGWKTIPNRVEKIGRLSYSRIHGNISNLLRLLGQGSASIRIETCHRVLRKLRGWMNLSNSPFMNHKEFNSPNVAVPAINRSQLFTRDPSGDKIVSYTSHSFGLCFILFTFARVYDYIR